VVGYLLSVPPENNDYPRRQGPSPMAEPPHRPWYAGATRAQWLALLAALLGWAFDGFEMGIFPQVSQPALIELLGLKDLHAQSHNKSLSESERAAAWQAVQE